MTQYDQKTTEGYTQTGMLTERIHRQHILYYSWQQALGDLTGLRCLDLGCGDGRSSIMMHELGSRDIVAIDDSLAMLNKAREQEERHPRGITYYESDMSRPPTQPPFDVVGAAASLHYSPDYEHLNNVFGGISRALKPGGRLVALVTRLDSPVKEYDFYTGSKVSWLDEPFENGSRLFVEVYDWQGNKVSEFVNYYWVEGLYRNLLTFHGFVNTELTLCTMSPEGSKLLAESNWNVSEKDLVDSMVMMIMTATKA